MPRLRKPSAHRREANGPAGPQQTAPFGQRALDGHVEECGRTDDRIEGLGGQVVEFAGIRLKQLDVPQSRSLDGGLCLLQHAGREVDADNATTRTYPCCGGNRCESGADAGVQHTIPESNRRVCNQALSVGAVPLTLGVAGRPSVKVGRDAPAVFRHEAHSRADTGSVTHGLQGFAPNLRSYQVGKGVACGRDWLAVRDDFRNWVGLGLKAREKK